MKYEQLPKTFAYGDRSSHQASDFSLRKNKRARRIVAGVYQGETELQLIPEWADSRWKDVYTLMSAVQDVRPDAVASHWAAAVLHGLPIPRGIKDFRHVTTPNAGSEVRIRGITGHRSRRLAAQNLLDIRVATIPYTLMQTAADLDHENAVIMLDALMGRWRDGPHVTPAALTDFLNRTKHFVGRSTLRNALVDTRPNTGSPKETELRRALLRAGLPEPAIQPKIWLPQLTYATHPDMAYVEEKLSLEYEGDHHRSDPRQWEMDIQRYEAFVEAGWQVVRVTRSTPVSRVVRRVERHLGL